MIDLAAGITVYPPQQDGDPWRAVWAEDGRRRFYEAVTEARLAAKLAKVTERLEADAPGDVAFIATGRGRGAPDRLGTLVQLCTLPWLGFVPDEVHLATAAVSQSADRLGVDPAVLSLYGQRAQTRSDQLGKIAQHLGWKTAPGRQQ